jgi:hypothetical protein
MSRYVSQTPSIGLEQFLTRPVRLTTITWLQSDAIGSKTTILPWQLFVNNAAITSKLNNYAYLRSKLKIKVIVNASPFYYGAMLVSYQPMQNFTPSNIVTDAAGRHYMAYSQRPHQWIYPQENQGFEMELPFLYHKDWLRLQVNQDIADMGILRFDIVNPLDSANGAVGSGVTIQVYGWMEEPDLSGPSVGLSLQGSFKINKPFFGAKPDMARAKAYGSNQASYQALTPDEYDGVVSKPASALAAAVGCLTRMPFIGYYARASQIGLTAIAGVASLFGFTNVPVVDDIPARQPRAFPAIATSEISFPVEKLTLDPKNELSIDPGLTGDSGMDNMMIPSIIQRESFVTSAIWNSTQVNNDIIMSASVHPSIFLNNGATQNIVHNTPLSHIAQLFTNWRGDIIYRFKIVGTQFHKGRLRLSFDPRGQAGTNIINTLDNTSMVFNKIIDISEETNIEVRVPYQQFISWMKIQGLESTVRSIQTGAAPVFSHIDGSTNGTWVLQVLTALTAPITTAYVYVQVFVRAADNFEFANPCNINRNYSLLAPQGSNPVEIASLYDPGESQLVLAGNAISEPNPNRYLINYGEAIISLRTLMRRYTLNQYLFITSSSNNFAYFQGFFSRLPRPYGFDPLGLERALGLITPASTFQFNYTFNTPLSWTQPMYIGYRGSTHIILNLDGQSAQHLRCQRNPLPISNTSYTTLSFVPVTYSSGARQFITQFQSGSSGSAITSSNVNNTLNVHAPNFSRFKFQSTNLLQINAPVAEDDSNIDHLLIEANLDQNAPNFRQHLSLHFGIGVDFSYVFFLNAPVVYIYTAVPPYA